MPPGAWRNLVEALLDLSWKGGLHLPLGNRFAPLAPITLAPARRLHPSFAGRADGRLQGRPLGEADDLHLLDVEGSFLNGSVDLDDIPGDKGPDQIPEVLRRLEGRAFDGAFSIL